MGVFFLAAKPPYILEIEDFVNTAELGRIANGSTVDSDLLDTINMIAVIMGGMKEESNEQ